ncbi:MAG: hypothetical protein NT141_03790 [candidate division WWE3 bacterium]|nr:hypothetical protein [candidate division WWE3 bacterium]
MPENAEITAMINKAFELIEKSKEDIKVIKNQLDEVLASDPVYTDAQKEVEVAREAKAMASQKAEANTTVTGLMNALKERKIELRDYKDSLSASLVEYYKATGSTEITTSDGKTYTFSFSARLS